MSFSSDVADLCCRVEESLFLDHKTGIGVRGKSRERALGAVKALVISLSRPHDTHLVPMKRPDPMARHTPIILNVVLFVSTRPLAADEVAETAADVADAVADSDIVDDIGARRGRVEEGGGSGK